MLDNQGLDITRQLAQDSGREGCKLVRLDRIKYLPVVDRERDIFLFVRMEGTSTFVVCPFDQLFAFQFDEMSNDVLGSDLLFG